MTRKRERIEVGGAAGGHVLRSTRGLIYTYVCVLSSRMSTAIFACRARACEYMRDANVCEVHMRTAVDSDDALISVWK